MTARSPRAVAIAASLAVAAALAASPARAAARPDLPAAVPAQLRALVHARMHTPPPHRLSWVSRFAIETKDGYVLTVTGVGDVVTVEVTKGPSLSAAVSGRRSHAAVTAYVARGTVTPGRVEASFGRFGRIAVRFRPSGRVVKSRPRRHCRGADRFTVRPGVFVGNVRFSGEGGYLKVRAHRAKGRIRRPLRLRCAERPPRLLAAVEGRPVKDLPSFSAGTLQAAWRESVAATEFFAFRFGDLALFLASTEASMGRVAEIRYAYAIAKARTFTQNEALTAAKVTPPRPFAGAGLYAAAPDGKRTWSGSLRAWFPGAPGYQLAGPRFGVRLESGY